MAYTESTKKWFDRWDLARVLWSGAEEDEDEGPGGWTMSGKRSSSSTKGLTQLVRGSLELGAPPEGPRRCLATRAVAGPATSALRALTREPRVPETRRPSRPGTPPLGSPGVSGRCSTTRKRWRSSEASAPETTRLPTGDRWWTTARRETCRPYWTSTSTRFAISRGYFATDEEEVALEASWLKR